MIGLAIFLLCIGAALLVIEAFIPGFGVFGISGIVSVIISAVITVLTVPYGVFLVLVEVAALAAVVFIIAKYLKKRQLYGKLILNEALDSTESEIGGLDYFQGKEGVTKTPLKPFGAADFNGITVEVCSEGGFIKENRSIKVIDVSKQKIVVSELKK